MHVPDSDGALCRPQLHAGGGLRAAAGLVTLQNAEACTIAPICALQAYRGAVYVYKAMLLGLFLRLALCATDPRIAAGRGEVRRPARPSYDSEDVTPALETQYRGGPACRMGLPPLRLRAPHPAPMYRQAVLLQRRWQPLITLTCLRQRETQHHTPLACATPKLNLSLLQVRPDMHGVFDRIAVRSI